MLSTQFLLLHEGKIDPRRITGLTTYMRSDKGVVKASGSPTNVQDWVDQSRVPYTFEEAVYENTGTNMGFEAALGAEWGEVIVGATGTSARSTDTAKYGDASLKLVMTDSANAADYIGRYQNIAALPGEVWSFGWWANFLAKTTCTVRVYMRFLDAAFGQTAAPVLVELSTLTSGFVQLSVLNQTAPALTAWVQTRVYLHAGAANDTGTCYFDGIQAVKSTSLPNIYSQGNSIKNSFEQRTTANQPGVTPAVFRGKPGVTFNIDLLRSILGAYLTGSSGLILVLSRLSAAGEFTAIFSSSDEATDVKYIFVTGRRANSVPNIYQLQLNDDPGDQIRGDTVVEVGLDYVDVWRSTGAAYSIRVNGREETKEVLGGADTGDWFADTTDRDNTVIGMTKRTTESAFFPGHIGLVLIYEGDPGMGARMKQMERMIRQRGLRALR